jgi:hypothetical protein
LLFRLLLTLSLAFCALAQTKSGCALLTLDEAATALGPGTASRDAGGICIFTSQKGSVTATITPNANNSFQIVKLTANQNGATVKDEPAIGVTAYSVTSKDGHGFSIFLLKGTWGAAISADAGAAKVSDLLRDRMRGLAKKAAARL